MADWDPATLPYATMDAFEDDITLEDEFEGDAKQVRQINPVRVRQIVVFPKPGMSKTELAAYRSFFASKGKNTYWSITLVDDGVDYLVKFTQKLFWHQVNIYPEYYDLDPIVLYVKGTA